MASCVISSSRNRLALNGEARPILFLRGWKKEFLLNYGFIGDVSKRNGVIGLFFWSVLGIGFICLLLYLFIFCIVIRLHGHLIKNAQSLLSGSCLSSNLCWTWVRSKAGQGKAGVTGERSKVWKRDASRFQFFFFFLLCLALISSLSFYGWAILLPLLLFSSSLRLLLL